MAVGGSWIFNPPGRKARLVTPHCRLHINTAEAAIDAAIRGVGITNVLSYQIEAAVAEKKLKIVLQDFEPPPIPVNLLHAHQGPLPVKMRRFLEYAAPRIRQSVVTTQKKLGYGVDKQQT